MAFLVQMLQTNSAGQERIMAFIGKDEGFPLWLPESVTDDLLTGSSITLLGASEEDKETLPADLEPSSGFIIQDWFGPFLLSPSSRFLRGRC